MSAKLFALTVCFVLLAEAVVLVPSISKQRITWLNARIESAYLVSVALESPEAEMIDSGTAEQLFATADIASVTVNRNDARFRIYAPEFEATEKRIVSFIDLTNHNPVLMIAETWSSLFASGDNLISVHGTPPGAQEEMVELLVSQSALRQSLIDYAWNIFLLSLFISTLTAIFIYQTLNRLIVTPVKKLTSNMAAFEQNPEGHMSLVRLGHRGDEIAEAEKGLIALETRIQSLLAERKRLAALGSGISKISHDLRNILASAQLMSDRLAKSDDPRVRRLSPRLISSLDRAISLSNDTVSYGKMSPAALKKVPVNIAELIDEIFEDRMSRHVVFENEIDKTISVSADRTQLYRSLFNLVGNAVDALSPPAPEDDPDGKDRLIAASSSVIDNVIHIDIRDNGNGLPEKSKEHLFEPFKGSQKPGGSGLGLAIAHEVMRAHGGDLILFKSDETGATFRLSLPL